MRSSSPLFRPVTRRWFIVLAVGASLGLVTLAVWLSRPAMSPLTNTTMPTMTPTASPTPVASPGQPGNPGDDAKSNIPTASVTPISPTATPVVSVKLSEVGVTYQGTGRVRATARVEGASAGSCVLTVSKDNQKLEATADIVFSGSYYSCSPTVMSGVTGTGSSWNVTVTATDSKGNKSNTFTGTVEVME
ncbi:hypothetical protein IPG36_01620 [bacterium]|nr:MAG: hypothetical protein IPG36_01620 [bacterium]